MPYKDEQILIIAPGSLTTLAQLGIPESIAPAQFRFKSRMFPSEKDSEWEPFKVNRKPTSQPSQPPTDDGIVQEEPEFVEDFETEEGAVWPLTEGRITNWSCFFGLLSYVHSRLGPHLHSPILLVAQPCWTSKDYERLTMFFFEKFKPPGFTIIDSATASLWAYNVVNACIVDVGLGKVDVTAITDFAIHTPGRGIAIPNCGGEAMTQRLLELLSDKGFSRDMCEQLKHSPICEVLLPGVPLPGSSGKPVDEITNPAAAASTGAVGSGPGQRHIAAALGEASMLEPGEEDPIENEGVLDVASIVTAGEKKMEEFLARKEREKAERAATRKKHSDAAAQTAARPAKMRNSERAKATFLYEDRAFSKSLGEANGSNGTAESQAPGPSGENAETSAQQADPKVGGRVRREVEVGVERLQVAGEIVDRIADAIHLAISSVDDVAKRSDVWDNLILVGNGAKVRGFRDALLAIIYKRYIISPSSATIFTSELPSQLTTPTGTGTNTPQPQLVQPHVPQFGAHGGPSSSVNPLLLTAVTSHNPHLNPSAALPSAHSQNIHSSHGQTPTSAKYAKMGEYFPEWKEVGYEEAQFLGAQVMAKVLFVVDQGQSKGFMTRNDYNDMGPSGIVEFGV